MALHGRGRENLEIDREIDNPLWDVQRCSQFLQADYDKFYANDADHASSSSFREFSTVLHLQEQDVQSRGS